MPSVFPGMNPYLEHPDLFPGLHHWLIIEIARLLSPQLRPKYRVAVEVRMYETADDRSITVGIPDVMVTTRQHNSDADSTNVAVATPTPKPVQVAVPTPITVKEGYLELIRKENLKETQLITRSKFQRISAVLTQIPETLTR